MKKVTLLLALLIMTLSGFAQGYFPLSITAPDDGSGTTPTVCSADSNGVYTVNVTMCTATSPTPLPMTVKWYFNGALVYTDPATPVPFTSPTTLTFTLPANTFAWPAPGSYGGAIGLRAEISWMPPFGPGPGCSGSPRVGASLTVFVANAAPPITGSTYICVGATHSLHSTATGGVWFPVSGANANAATSGVDERIGLITGVSVGTTVITYTGGSCNQPATIVVTVVTTPPPILPPNPIVCSGEQILLTDTMWGGTWISGGLATVDPFSGLVTGAPTPVGGTATITYQLTTACRTVTTVTVYPMPTPITGTMMFCSGVTSTLASTPTGGTWSSSTPAIATVGASNGAVFGVAGGTDTITYNRFGCKAIAVVTVEQSPTAISGPSAVCTGGTIALGNAVTGGTWSSSDVAVGTVDVTTGVVTGLTTGTTIISYKVSICAPATKIVTVTAFPAAIGGNVPVCVNSTITLTNSVPGGTWSESSIRMSINTFTGVDTGISAGTGTVTYSIGNGCNVTAVVTVNPLPQPITGDTTVCFTFTETLSDVDPGGTWSSSSPGNVSVSPPTPSATGIITGNAVGSTATITYTLPTGCRTTRTATVSPLPSAIVGPPLMAVCEASTITLTNPTLGGGTWSSSNTTNASVGSSTGIVTGAFGGVSGTTATISFTATNTGCFTSRTVSVNPLPTAFNVTGGGSYCAGSPTPITIGMLNAVNTISYRLYLGATPVGSPVTGVTGSFNFGTFTAAGTYTVLATNPSTTCTNSMLGSAVITINPVVTPAISMSMTPTVGVDTLCAGLPATFTATPSNGGPSPTYQWMVNGAPVGTSSPTHVYTPTSGDVISVTLTTSAPCSTTPTAVSTHTLTVLPSGMPSVTTSVIPGTTVCAGTPVTFSAIPTNGGSAPTFRWTKNGTNVATGPTWTYIPANGDVIYCMMRSSATCNLIDSAFSPLTTMTVVTPGAPPSVFISATPGTTITPGTSVTLIASAVGAGTTPTFQWYLNGVAIAGATSATYVSATFNNHDSVTCIVTSSNICKEKGAKSEIITVKNGNGGVGVGSLEVGQGVDIVPNPNNGVFTIKGQWSNENNEKVSLEVTDMVGKVIYTGNVTTKAGQVNTQITLPSVPAGMYMINMRSDSGNRVFRVVKE